MDRYKSFGPLRERCRPEINSSREVATRERCGKIFHPCSVPPQKAGGENVVFKMNNSPVTPLPSLPPLYTRILEKKLQLRIESSPRSSSQKKKKWTLIERKEKKHMSKLWIKTLISWSMARSRAYQTRLPRTISGESSISCPVQRHGPA